MRSILLIVGALLACNTTAGYADEGTRIIASSGEWAAMSHAPSQMAAPDTCMAASTVGSNVFLLRVDEDTKEIRVANKTWTLPAGIKGSFNVTIGAYHRTFDIDHNTDSMITAVIEGDTLVEFINAMDKGSTMSVSAGKSAPMSFGLSGSTRVTNALKVCAGIREKGKAGSNPFE